MSSAVAPVRVKVFLSWAHADRRLKTQLIKSLQPTLGALRDVEIMWWEDSHLYCGEEALPGILDRLDEADYGLLLLSPHFFGSSFIREHELPRFAGPTADRKALPVALRQLPGFGPEWDLGGVERQLVFNDGQSFEELRSHQRTAFANRLATEIRRRLIGQNGYRSL